MKNRSIKVVGFWLSVAVGFQSCDSESTNNKEDAAKNQISSIAYTQVGTYPHSKEAFTEGLFIYDGNIYESTGSPANLSYTESVVGILDTTNGSLDVKVKLDRNKYFGEGISILGDKLYQLTYVSQECFVYDKNTFEKLESFKFPNTEGWGMTTDGTHLIMSDGTFKITYVNPLDFSKVREINVKENGYGVENINELEYVNGFIYANVYGTNVILKIDADNGNVVSKSDFGTLYLDAQKGNPALLEMNGIAYDAAKNELLVTGKLWTKIYRLKLK